MDSQEGSNVWKISTEFFLQIASITQFTVPSGNFYCFLKQNLYQEANATTTSFHHHQSANKI